MSKSVNIELVQELCRKNYLLFAPRRSNDLKKEYDELAENPAFKPLSKEEMLFVWYMRCPTSPFEEYDDEVKLEPSIQLAWQDEAQREHRRTEYKEDYPTKIAVAMQEMSKFDLPHRLLNRKYAESFYATLSDIAKTRPFEDGLLDVAQAKAYADMTKSVIGSMREYSTLLEGGSAFGITEDDGLIKLKAGEALRAFHQSQAH